METSSIENLKQKRSQCLHRSERVIINKPGAYANLKLLLKYVVSHKVDIDEYNTIVEKLTRLIEEMGQETIFYNYFYEHIHPEKSGCVRYFRFVCRDLLIQINELSKWRFEKKRLEILK